MLASQAGRGYTLVEFLVVCLVTLTILYCAVWGIRGLLSKNRVRLEARRLTMNIEEMNLASKLRERDLALTIFAESYSAQDEGGRILFVHNFADGVKASVPEDEEEKNITSYASGVMTPATVVLSYNEFQCVVVASLRGRVRWSC